MTHAKKIARDEALAEALRTADEAIGDDQPTDQAFRIIAALKRLREGATLRVVGLSRVDYLSRLQMMTRAKWKAGHDEDQTGPEHDATAGIDTPLGRLRMVVWRRVWIGHRGSFAARVAWSGEYYLNDEPITVAEIRAAGLAQRPTTRNRQKRSVSK